MRVAKIPIGNALFQVGVDLGKIGTLKKPNAILCRDASEASWQPYIVAGVHDFREALTFMRRQPIRQAPLSPTSQLRLWPGLLDVVAGDGIDPPPPAISGMRSNL